MAENKENLKKILNIFQNTKSAYEPTNFPNGQPYFTAGNTYSVSTTFQATDDGASAVLEFYTSSDVEAEFIVHSASVRPINSKDFQSNLLNDDNFFSQIWHKTLGGTFERLLLTY